MIEIDWKPDRKKLRGFAIISVVAFGAIGAWVFFRHTFLWMQFEGSVASTTAYALWCVAALCLILGLLAPKAILPLYCLLTAISVPIGYVLSHVLMGIAYYGILTPIGVFFRISGRDPLQRRLDPKASTYWVERAPASSASRYFRQF